MKDSIIATEGVQATMGGFDIGLMSDTELDATLAARPGISVTRELIEERIARVDFMRSGSFTLCIFTMVNGFQVTGQAGCADPRNFNERLGERYAYDDAIRAAWPLEGYLLRQQLHDAAN